MKINITKALAVFLFFVIFDTAAANADVLNGFSPQNSYSESVYEDVGSDDWFDSYVGFVYEYGIMNGTASGVFSPYGNMSIAEAIAVASRLHATYYGNEISESYIPGLPFTWYAPYLVYAYSNDICSFTDFGINFTDSATRAQIAYLLYHALPSCYDKKINTVELIPDIAESDDYYSEIKSLYEAGILTGSDKYGTFGASLAVSRAEAAAMLSRIINTNLRVSFELQIDNSRKQLKYQWVYNRRVFTISLSVLYRDYNYFASKPRTYDYASYAKDDADVDFLTDFAQELQALAVSSGYSSPDKIAEFICAFVQSLEYQQDSAFKGAEEYPKYPIETLFDCGGDCEDTAVLLAKMLKLLGYNAVLLSSDNHMAVGLATNGTGNVTYEGVNYFYVETTGTDWAVGEVPDDMIGVSIEILTI